MRCTRTLVLCGGIQEDRWANSGLAALIRFYIQRKRRDARRELAYFAGMPSLELAIESAALATDEGGKRFSHQCRLTGASLRAGKARLNGALSRIRACRSFDELLVLVEQLAGNIYGLGELYVYDTALRLGAYLRLMPQAVYLHRGTRIGAKALGFNGGVRSIESPNLPRELRRLHPHEIEDFLCIFKRDLSRSIGKPRLGVR